MIGIREPARWAPPLTPVGFHVVQAPLSFAEDMPLLISIWGPAVCVMYVHTQTNANTELEAKVGLTSTTISVKCELHATHANS